MFFFNLATAPERRQFLAPQVQAASAAGIHIYSTTFESWPWENGSTELDYSVADHQMDLFLQVDPKAVFLLRIGVGPPPSWLGWATYDQWRRFDDNLYSDGSTAIVSIASERYFQSFITSLRKLIQHYESSRYAARILGYHIVGQNTGEWFPMKYVEKGPDYSPASHQAFRAWLRSKYRTDSNLTSAWGRAVAIGDAPIPTPSPGRFPITGSKPRDLVETFYRVPAEQDWIDYSDYISDIISSRLLAIAAEIKADTQRKKLVAFFNGYIFDLPGSMNGHLRIARLLDSPDIDVLIAPISYSDDAKDRLAGRPGGAMTATDSVAAHGKLWINEDDFRTYIAGMSTLPDVGYNGPAASGFTETFNVLQRNLASALTHRAGTWWMDLNAVGAFNDPGLWKVMSDYGLPLFDELYASPRPYRPDVALIVDSSSVLYQKNDWDFMAIPRTTLRNTLAKTGASIGYYYLDDFIDGTLPPCKVYVFANTWFLSDDQISTIRARLQREGATAIWLYAPGYIGPSGPDIARTERLTGMTLRVADGAMVSDGSGILVGMGWGWAGERILSPRLLVTDSTVTVLGRYRSDRQVSTAIKAGSFQSIIIGDIQPSVEMLRALLKQSGVHLWTDRDDIVHTDGGTIVIHSSGAGIRQVQLPIGSAMTSLDGVFRPKGNPVPLNFSVTGDTQWFRLIPIQ